MLVDSHCHLDHLKLDDREGGLNAVLADAQAKGITQFLSVAVDLETSASLVKLTAQYDNIYSSVGVHPLQKITQPVHPPGIHYSHSQPVSHSHETLHDLLHTHDLTNNVTCHTS